MAIAIANTSIGTPVTNDVSSTTVVLTTGVTINAGEFIVISLSWFGSGVTVSSAASSPALSWTVDKQGQGTATQDHAAICSALAPSGLASGSTITATFSGNTAGKCIGGASFTGVATSSPVDTTNGPTSATTNWATGSVTILAGSLLYATSGNQNANVTSTITSPSLEVNDFGNAGGFASTAGYRIEASAGAYTVAGTWGSAVTSATVGVAYKADAGAAAAVMTPSFTPIPFMG